MILYLSNILNVILKSRFITFEYFLQFLFIRSAMYCVVAIISHFGLHSQATRLEGKVTTVSRQPYGPITLYGQWPLSSWTLTCQPDREETLPNATFREAKMTCSYAMA